MLPPRATTLASLLFILSAHLAQAQHPTNKSRSQSPHPTLTIPFYTVETVGTTTYAASVINANEEATTLHITALDDYGRTWLSKLVAGPSTYSMSISLDPGKVHGEAILTQSCAAISDFAICQEYASYATEDQSVTTYPASSIQSAPIVVTAGAEKLANLLAATTSAAETVMRTPSSVPKTQTGKMAASPSVVQTEGNATVTSRPTLTLPFYTYGNIEPTLSASIIDMKNNTTTLLLDSSTIIAGPDTYFVGITIPALEFSYSQNCSTEVSSTVGCEEFSTAKDLYAIATAIYLPRDIQTALVAVTGGAEKLDQQRVASKTSTTSTIAAGSTHTGGASPKGIGKEIGLVIAVGMVVAMA